MNPLLNLFDKVLKDNPEIEATVKRVTERLKTFGESMSNFLKKAPACANLDKTPNATNEYLRTCVAEIIRHITEQEKPKESSRIERLTARFCDNVTKAEADGFTREEIEKVMLKFVSSATLRKGDQTK